MFLALLLGLTSLAHAGTTWGSLQNQSVSLSTSGVIGSISPGNSAGKTNVFVSSSAQTAAVGSTLVLSSRTVSAGKTFYLQHVDVWGYLSVPSTSTAVNMGSLAIGTGPGGAAFTTKVASMTIIGGQISAPIWVMEFSEPIPFAAGQVVASSVTANTATAVTWVTNFIGYEK